MKIEVIGNSGCKVEVVREDTRLFVLKSTEDPKYLARLALQAEKQKTASSIVVPNIIVPKVYNILRNNDKTEVRMDYIYSQNYIDYFENAGVHEIEAFVEAMIAFVEQEINVSPISECSNDVLMAKFEDVVSKVSKRPYNNDKLKELLDKARIRLKTRGGMLRIPVGVCHGDLTFSNILFCGQQYCLIDFLDSFIETPLQDIVKLRQDSHYLWSCMMYQEPYDALRLKLISEYVDKRLDEHFSQYDWYNEHYKVLQLMNMLRILPYAKDENVVEYLKGVIKSLV